MLSLIFLFLFNERLLLADSVDVSTVGVRAVWIKGYRGLVTINSSESEMAKVTYTKSLWGVNVRKNLDRLEIEVIGPSDKQVWLDAIEKGQVPSVNLEISMPPLPLEMAWREGSVTIRNWTAAAELRLVQAQVLSEEGGGSLSADVHSGLIKISKHKGDVKVIGYDPKLEIDNIEGEVMVDNYTGISRFSSITGNLTLTAYRGLMSVAQGKGKLEVENDRATIKIENHEGPLRGKTTLGTVMASLKGEIDVQLKSDDGDVKLKVLDSGADVNLATEKGQLLVPSFLQTYRTETRKTARGKLRGGQPGRIYVRSQSGSVQIN